MERMSWVVTTFPTWNKPARGLALITTHPIVVKLFLRHIYQILEAINRSQHTQLPHCLQKHHLGLHTASLPPIGGSTTLASTVRAWDEPETILPTGGLPIL